MVKSTQTWLIHLFYHPHKDIIKADNISHKTQRLWLEAAASLATIVDKIGAGEIEEADIIYRISNALLLLGNS